MKRGELNTRKSSKIILIARGILRMHAKKGWLLHWKKVPNTEGRGVYTTTKSASSSSMRRKRIPISRRLFQSTAVAFQLVWKFRVTRTLVGVALRPRIVFSLRFTYVIIIAIGDYRLINQSFGHKKNTLRIEKKLPVFLQFQLFFIHRIEFFQVKWFVRAIFFL